jgi:transposase
MVRIILNFFYFVFFSSIIYNTSPWLLCTLESAVNAVSNKKNLGRRIVSFRQDAGVLILLGQLSHFCTTWLSQLFFAITAMVSPFHSILESSTWHCISQLREHIKRLFCIHGCSFASIIHDILPVIKNINPDTQKTAVARLNQGVSVKHVVSRLNIGVATVSKLRTQFLPHLKRQSSGRPGILSKTDKHTIARKMLSGVLKTRKETFKYLRGVGVPISYSCVLDNLQKLGFKAKKKN